MHINLTKGYHYYYDFACPLSTANKIQNEGGENRNVVSRVILLLFRFLCTRKWMERSAIYRIHSTRRFFTQTTPTHSNCAQNNASQWTSDAGAGSTHIQTPNTSSTIAMIELWAFIRRHFCLFRLFCVCSQPGYRPAVEKNINWKTSFAIKIWSVFTHSKR